MWLVCGRHLVVVWSVCGQYVVVMWSVCNRCVAGMWWVWGVWFRCKLLTFVEIAGAALCEATHSCLVEIDFAHSVLISMVIFIRAARKKAGDSSKRNCFYLRHSDTECAHPRFSVQTSKFKIHYTLRFWLPFRAEYCMNKISMAN